MCVFFTLHSIDELGNWYLTGWQGACTLQAQQGGIHGNLASRNHPYMQLPPGTVTLKRVQWKKILTLSYTYLTHELRGQEGWEQGICNDSQKNKL